MVHPRLLLPLPPQGSLLLQHLPRNNPSTLYARKVAGDQPDPKDEGQWRAWSLAQRGSIIPFLGMATGPRQVGASRHCLPSDGETVTVKPFSPGRSVPFFIRFHALTADFTKINYGVKGLAQEPLTVASLVSLVGMWYPVTWDCLHLPWQNPGQGSKDISTQEPC